MRMIKIQILVDGKWINKEIPSIDYIAIVKDAGGGVIVIDGKKYDDDHWRLYHPFLDEN